MLPLSQIAMDHINKIYELFCSDKHQKYYCTKVHDTDLRADPRTDEP